LLGLPFWSPKKGVLIFGRYIDTVGVLILVEKWLNFTKWTNKTTNFKNRICSTLEIKNLI